MSNSITLILFMELAYACIHSIYHVQISPAKLQFHCVFLFLFVHIQYTDLYLHLSLILVPHMLPVNGYVLCGQSSTPKSPAISLYLGTHPGRVQVCCQPMPTKDILSYLPGRFNINDNDK